MQPVVSTEELQISPGNKITEHQLGHQTQAIPCPLTILGLGATTLVSRGTGQQVQIDFCLKSLSVAIHLHLSRLSPRFHPIIATCPYQTYVPNYPSFFFVPFSLNT